MRNHDPALAGKRVLVLDDEPLLAFQMADLLAEQGADVIGPATSIEEALALLEETPEPLDGAVLDIQIGGDMVWPVAKRLAEDGTPFLFVSAWCDALGSRNPFPDRDCVPKPFNRSLLNARLAALIPDRKAA